MSERDEPTGQRATPHEGTPPWERDVAWYKREAGLLELALQDERERTEVARRALGEALKMPPPGLRDHYAAALAPVFFASLEPSELLGTDEGVISMLDGASHAAFLAADRMLSVRDKAARVSILAVELAAAMVEVEELEAADDPGDGIAAAGRSAELEDARHRVTRAFAEVLAEWRRR